VGLARSYSRKNQDIRSPGEIQTNPGWRNPASGIGKETAVSIPPRAMERNCTIAIGLALLVAVPYAQVVNHQFLVLDDPAYITRNPRVLAGLTWEGAVWAFTSIHAYNWHPLTGFPTCLTSPFLPARVCITLRTSSFTSKRLPVSGSSTGTERKEGAFSSQHLHRPSDTRGIGGVDSGEEGCDPPFRLLTVLWHVRYAASPSRIGFCRCRSSSPRSCRAVHYYAPGSPSGPGFLALGRAEGLHVRHRIIGDAPRYRSGALIRENPCWRYRRRARQSCCTHRDRGSIVSLIGTRWGSRRYPVVSLVSYLGMVWPDSLHPLPHPPSPFLGQRCSGPHSCWRDNSGFLRMARRFPVANRRWFWFRSPWFQ
jgi:hypothetical protein